jgi:hypothetical protein
MLSYSVNGPRVLMECAADQEATCDHITLYEWAEQSEFGWYRQTGHSCAPDHDSGYLSSLDFYFHNSRQF